jgi:hypothetical protein
MAAVRSSEKAQGKAPVLEEFEPALTKQLFFIKDSLIILQKFVLRGVVWKSGIWP